MLEFTGSINGEMYEEQAVSVSQLIKHFGVTIPKNLTIERITGKRDRYGQRKESNQVILNPYFNAVFNGEQFTLRYYANKNKRSDQTISYLPKKIRFNGTKVFDQKDQEVALFLFLHPQNAASPFSARLTFVKTSDKVAESQVRLDAAREAALIQAMIINESDGNKIQRVARGFKHKGETISTIHTNDSTMAKVALLDMAKKYPFAVKEALEDEETLIRGIVGLAEDSGRISLRNNSWYIEREMYLNVDKFEDPVQKLQNYLSDHANLTKFLSKVYKMNINVSSELSDINIVQKAIDDGRIILEDGKAWITNESGEKSGIPIGRFESFDELLTAGLPKGILGRIRKVV
jgi:hypothetical protein